MVVFFLLGVKINVWSRYEWLHEGQGVSRPHRQGWGGLSWNEEEMGLVMVAVTLHGPLWPFSCPMIPYIDQIILTELPAPVTIATSAHWEMSQLLRIKYSPYRRRLSVCPLILYIPLPSTGPLGSTCWHNVLKCISVLCHFIKTTCLEQMM